MVAMTPSQVRRSRQGPEVVPPNSIKPKKSPDQAGHAVHSQRVHGVAPATMCRAEGRARPTIGPGHEHNALVVLAGPGEHAEATKDRPPLDNPGTDVLFRPRREGCCSGTPRARRGKMHPRPAIKGIPSPLSRIAPTTRKIPRGEQIHVEQRTESLRRPGIGASWIVSQAGWPRWVSNPDQRPHHHSKTPGQRLLGPSAHAALLTGIARDRSPPNGLLRTRIQLPRNSLPARRLSRPALTRAASRAPSSTGVLGVRHRRIQQQPRPPPAPSPRSHRWPAPTPASTITGNDGSPALSNSKHKAILARFSTPWPLPIGLPAGNHARGPRLFDPQRRNRVIARIRQHLEPILDQFPWSPQRSP